MSRELSGDFFRSATTLELAQRIVGCEIAVGDKRALITETEAYLGVSDRACHAYGGRRTRRTETMFQAPGTLYVYLCYGIHQLLNFVCQEEGVPEAILIRAVQPLFAHEKTGNPHKPISANGPGKLTRMLGVGKAMNGTALGQDMRLYDRDVTTIELLAGPRVGVDYAGPDAALPYRFRWAGNPYIGK